MAIEPAAPDAVTTEVNGTTAVPSDRSMAGQLRVGAGEPVAVGDRARAASRRPGTHVWSSPSGAEEPVAQLVGDRARADGLGEHAQDQVVRVRVVPAVPGLTYGLPT